MAAVLTDELTRVSVADIEKWEEDGDTLYVYGRCTTPEIDTDDQRVSAEWSGPALKEYLATAPTVRVQHNPQRDPAGSAVRVDVNRDGDGAHWLKAAVDEPIAQRLVKRGHLRAFSVGIARPVIERDVTGKARGGIISGGKIVEVSLVDSPANRSCFLEVAKSAADGTCEFTGKLFGDEDVIQKAIGGDLLTKAVAPAEAPAAVDTWTPPGDLSISFTPDDMMRVMQSKFVSRHYDDLAVEAVKAAEALVYKRDIDTATRRRLAAEGHALPNLSYPIENTGDLQNAAVLARSGHGDVAAARRLIAREARERGVANPLDESDEVKKSSSEVGATDEEALTMLKGLQTAMLVEERAANAQQAAAPEVAAKEAEPDLTKDPEPEPEPKRVKKAKKPPKGKKKLPPWLAKPKDGDDAEGDSDSGACKQDHAHTEKCHTTPAEAAGLTASHDMTCAPVPELLETPPVAAMKAGPTPASASGAVAAHMESVPAHREPDGALADPFEADAGLSDGDAETPTRLEAPMVKGQPEVSARMRFKAAGIDDDLGTLHDLCCPAYHPDEVAKHHPFAGFSTVIDEGAFMRKALAAAAGPTDAAKAATQMWNSAAILKAADPGMLNDFRLAAYKAFRDANPGPSSYPTPGSMSPARYNRPLVTDGHEASSPGHSGPNSSPEVAGSAPNAHSFDRPPLAAGHQSPSPSHMKQGGGEYPATQGAPVQLQYAHMEKDQARMALVRAHDQLSRQFPEVCPLDSPDSRPLRAQQAEGHPVPAVAGIGKSEGGACNCSPNASERAVACPVHMPPLLAKAAASPAPVAEVVKAAPEAETKTVSPKVYKGFKKMRKKLGKKVLAGTMTVDEARSRMGRQFAQKGSDEPAEAVQKGLLTHEEALARYGLPAQPPAAEPTAIKAAAAPLAAPFDPEVIKAAVAEATAELKDLLVKQQDTFTTKLAEQQKVIDAIADQPDPSTAAFSGLAYRPALTKQARPAGVTEIAESHAAQARQLVRQELQNTYYTHSDPAAREAAAQAIARLGSGGHTMT